VCPVEAWKLDHSRLSNKQEAAMVNLLAPYLGQSFAGDLVAPRRSDCFREAGPDRRRPRTPHGRLAGGSLRELKRVKRPAAGSARSPLEGKHAVAGAAPNDGRAMNPAPLTGCVRGSAPA
jgi:hypothetical protein